MHHELRNLWFIVVFIIIQPMCEMNFVKRTPHNNTQQFTAHQQSNSCFQEPTILQISDDKVKNLTRFDQWWTKWHLLDHSLVGSLFVLQVKFCSKEEGSQPKHKITVKL